MKRGIKCPNCGAEIKLEGNPYRPFCSRRCKIIDLGAWLGEEYYISSPITERDLPQDKFNEEGEERDGE